MDKFTIIEQLSHIMLLINMSMMRGLYKGMSEEHKARLFYLYKVLNRCRQLMQEKL